MKYWVNKTLVLLLAFCLALGSVGIYVTATDEAATLTATQSEDYTDADGKKVELLLALNIMSGLPQAQEVISRGEFSRYICGLMNAELVEKSTSHFTDVEDGDSYFHSVNTVYEYGIMNGIADTVFAPDEPMNYNDALVAVTRVLGYDIAAKKNGAYPTGYAAVASDLGLGTITSGSTAKLTGKAFVRLFYKALFTEILEEAAISKDGITYEKNGTRLLLNKFGYDKYIGMVVADEFVSLKGRARCEYGFLVIEQGGTDYIYHTDNVNTEGLIGKSVEFYADSEGEIVAIFEKVTNKEVVIDGVDLVDVDNYIREIKYRESNGKSTKTAKIENTADLIYNGVNDTLSRADVLNANGEIRLLNLDGDSKYECVIVTNYEYYLSAGITSAGVLKDMRAETSFDFHLEDPEYHTVVYKYGIKTSASMIGASECVAVAASRNTTGDKKIVAWVYDNLVVGTVNALSDDEITIEETEYEFAKNFATDTLYLGDRALFGLDSKGRISAYKKQYGAERKYIYVTEFGSLSGLNKTPQLYGLNDSGEFLVYDFEEKYRVNKEKGTFENLQENMFAGGVEVKPQLVAVQLSENGKISSIEFDNTPDGPLDGDAKDTFTFNKSFTDGNFDRSNRSLSAEYWLGTDTKVFALFIGSGNAIHEEASAAGTKAFKTMSSNRLVDMDIYDAKDEDRIAGAIVLKIPVSNFSYFYGGDGLFVVQEVVTMRNNDGDFVPAAKGYRLGSDAVCIGEPDMCDVTTWKPGDVYSTITGPNGKVFYASKVFELSVDSENPATFAYDKLYTAESPAINSTELVKTESAMVFGTLRNISTGDFSAAYIKAEGSGTVYSFQIVDYTNFMRYNIETQTVQKITKEDAVAGMGKVLITAGYGKLNNMIIFE